MSVYWRIALFGLSWWAALLGVLQLTHLPGNWGHALCGPWGCGPPLQSLAACHCFWIVLIAPLAGVAIRSWPPRSLQQFGLALFGLGVIALAGVAAWQAVAWLPTISAGEPTYFVQHYVFTLATLVEAPILPVTLAGAVCWTIGSRRRSRESRAVDCAVENP